MKTSILKICSVVCIAILVSSAITMSSCNKDKTCHGKVHVIDIAGAAVGAAAVTLAVTGGDVSYNGSTDGSGDVTFEVTLPAIFDVKATKAGVGVTGIGTGVIRLDEPGKEDDVTVTIQ